MNVREKMASYLENTDHLKTEWVQRTVTRYESQTASCNSRYIWPLNS